MHNLYGIEIFDFDIYSKRISLFLNKRDKIGTSYGLFLTFLYVLITLVLFFIYLSKAIERTDVKSNEMTLYSEGLPSINIRPQLLYFAFALENQTTLTRFIDEEIYYPKVFFILQKKENGIILTKQKLVLNIERCDIKKFGKEYQRQFSGEELNNSYCLKDFNLTLVGGSKYEESSFIQIKMYPCVNNSENNNKCKSQKIIDSYLASGYFSITIKDIGLNPLNYSFPIIPTIQHLKTNVDITMCRESLIYLGITEIQTDIGLFANVIKKENYLEYRKYSQSFFFINETEYHNGKEIFSGEIKLEEYIHVQKREYIKMAEVFSITGGYMQLISAFFTIINLFTKNFSFEKKILNKLFYFNIKQRKIILGFQYGKKLNYLVQNENGEINSFIPFLATKAKSSKSFFNLDINEQRKKNNSKSNHNFSPIMNPIVFPGKILNLNNKENISYKGEPCKISKFSNSNKNENNNNFNLSKMMLFKQTDINSLQNYEKKKIKKGKLNYTNDIIDFKNNIINSKLNVGIKLNIFTYYFGCKKKGNKNIELFNFGVNFYRNQMSIINIFNLIFMLQILLVKQSSNKFNTLNQIIEISP